jgi:hypothetical protein
MRWVLNAEPDVGETKTFVLQNVGHAQEGTPWTPE